MNKPTVADLGEHALIERIRTRLTAPPWVIVGPGDDAAVVEPERGTQEVLTTDALVEGVHFDRRFVSPDAIGHRALAVNLSDLAAMGASPRMALLSLILPDSLECGAFDGILDGLLGLATRHGVTVVGGNITRSPGPLILDVTAIGTIRRRRALTRRGARPGDIVYVTGHIGDAATGLKRLTSAREPSELHGPDVDRYLRPEPRIRAGTLLSRNKVASSAIDLSDGLADAARQLSQASGVGMLLDGSVLPMSDSMQSWHQLNGLDPVETALSGGDDYELLFTVRPNHHGRLRGARQQIGDLPITRIGIVTRDTQLLVTTQGSARVLPNGFEHFR